MIRPLVNNIRIIIWVLTALLHNKYTVEYIGILSKDHVDDHSLQRPIPFHSIPFGTEVYRPNAQSLISFVRWWIESIVLSYSHMSHKGTRKLPIGWRKENLLNLAMTAGSRVESSRTASHRMFCAYHRNTSVNKTELLDTRTLETQTS